jgi:hypothetical protein
MVKRPNRPFAKEAAMGNYSHKVAVTTHSKQYRFMRYVLENTWLKGTYAMLKLLKSMKGHRRYKGL